MYFWQSEYEKLYECLDKQKFDKDTSFCLKQYSYKL